MTTTTVFASSDWRLYSADNTYTNALAGTGSTQSIDGSVGGSAAGCGLAYNASAPNYRVYQSLFQFDTSAVGTDQTITDVDFNLAFAAFDTTAGDFVMEARDHPNALTTPTFAEGFATQSDLTGNSHFAKWDTAVEGTTAGTRATFTLVSLGLAAAAINKGGNSDISIATDGQKNASAAWSSNEYSDVYYIERIGTTQDPQLVVYHIDTPPGNVPMWGCNF